MPIPPAAHYINCPLHQLPITTASTLLQKYLEAQVLWLVTKCEIKFYDMEPQRFVVSET